MSQFVALDDRQWIHSRPPPAPSHTYTASKENQPPNVVPAKLDFHKTSAPPWSTSGIPPWSTATRPLSDIRELTEPSLADLATRKAPPKRDASKKSGMSESQNQNQSIKRKDSVVDRLRQALPNGTPSADKSKEGEAHSPAPSISTPGDKSSIYSIPLANVPPRSSSKHRSDSQPRGAILGPQPPKGYNFTIPNRGQSRSPVRELAARLNPVSFETARRIPSRTFVRSQQPLDILDAPTHKHPRISVDLHINASLFVGGGSIEGHVRVNVDDADRHRHKRGIALNRISVDLLGVEEMTGGKRSVFLNLASELLDAENPPPRNMVESPKQLSPIDPFWSLASSISSVPFLLSLPLDVGPPPFQSKHARIRYILCVSLVIRDQGRIFLVRTSQDVQVLSVYDPEKALMSLPSPLTATEDYVRHSETSIQRMRVTAGLHRQVWVSGQNIFVDVHIANHTRKTIKRVELQLERDILCYKHAAAATMEKSVSQARIFDSNERTILNKVVFKQHSGSNWNGVPAHSTDVRTYDLELPRGHATVKCGKFFEVRYFLNILVGTSHTKLATVQLPIVLIHMNSLDVVPNSVAQVAAAIEEKRTAALESRLPHSLSQRSSRARRRQREHIACRPSQGVQGRAFSAPRKQSLDRIQADAEELSDLGHILDSTPRRYATGSAATHKRLGSNFEYHTPPSNRKGRHLYGEEYEEMQRRLRHIPSNETNRSAHSIQKDRTNPPSRMSSRGSRRAGAGSAIGSSAGFREAEVEELGTTALGLRSTSGSVKPRIEGAKARNFVFHGRGRSKSKDGWRAWFGGDYGREREKNKARDGWI